MALRELLSREIVHGPVTAALAVCDSVRDDLDAALALVDDPGEDSASRVATLLAIALAAQDDVPLPDHAVDVLEDDLLIDAAIAARAESAITGILVASPRASERLRKYLALRLAAAGAIGLHVAALLFAVSDYAGAGRAALPALVADVRAHAEQPDTILALASILAGWTQANREFGERLCATLPPDVARTLAPAARYFDPYTAALLDAVG
jgi:hypothetical protein